MPRYRGAALARLEVAADRAATLILHMPDGTAVRAGASARLGDGQSAFVGYDGELFLPNAARGMTIEVNTGEGVCRATLGALPDEPLPRIGPIPCVLGVSA